MKYLKLTNIPLSLLKDQKYGGSRGKFDWEEIGFNVEILKIGSFQATKPDGDVIAHYPIADEEKVAELIEDLTADAAIFTSALTGRASNASLEIISQEEADACRVMCDEIRAAQSEANA